MKKSELAAWYFAVAKAASETRPGNTQEELEEWDFFFLWWGRDLWLEAGRPTGFPWRVDCD